MANLNFNQKALGEFKIDSIPDFCMNGIENDVVLYCNAQEFFILDMLYACDILNNIPFQIRHVKVPQEKPLLNLVKHVDYTELYRSSNVLETQQLALDHIYIAECSMEAPKARLLQAVIVPGSSSSNSRLCCALTTYGVCELLGQDPTSLEWFPLNTKLNQLLISDVFPIQKSPSNISTFAELRKFVDTYYITAFAWCSRDLVYLGTADGYVVAFRYRETDKEFEFLDKLQTSLGRITYLTTANHLLLAGCWHGQVCLLKFDHNNKSLRQMDYLWSKKDRMACRKAIIIYNVVLQSYLVVFCKAAHILAYRLDSEGCIMSNSTSHLKGVKITGLESLTDNEFIITTIMCTIHHATISFPQPEKLNIDVQIARHDLDAANFQILGVAASKSRNLWSFLLFRNKDYTHQSKFNVNTALLSVCKLNTYDSVTKLSNLNLTVMNTAQDLLIAINMDINNNCDAERYNSFLDINLLKCPLEITDSYVQKLQMKFTIIQQITNSQKMRFKSVKLPVKAELNFLASILQMFHILQRLKYLKTSHMGMGKLSTFQELSVICMQTQFLRLLENLTNVEGDTPNHFETAKEHFSKVTLEIYEKCKFDNCCMDKLKENCSICNAAINFTTFDKCENGHEVKRCTISYLQLPLFATQCCPNCFALAANDDTILLKELFGPNEVIKCTFCRYLLRNDIY